MQEKTIRSVPPKALYTWPNELSPLPEESEIELSPEVWAIKPHFREVKNIVPPIAGVNPPASATLITEEVIHEGGIINLGFNAYLHLPADALVDERGNPVDEPVKISYCPLSDPVDVYLSGVPMSYDSSGRTETFRTAGMIRLEAETWSGKKVRLKKGRSMRLDMPTSAETDDFNFYTFNEEKGGWNFNRPAPPARPAIDLLIDTLDFQYPFDTTRFGQKFSDMRYHYLTNSQVKRRSDMRESGKRYTPSLEKSIRDALYYSRFTATNMIRLVPFSAVIGYTKDQKPVREVRFKLSLLAKGSLYFRELRHFQGIAFVAEDMAKVQDFYKLYRRGKKFHDIRVDYEKGADYCTLVLKDEKQILRLKARISRRDRVGLRDFSKIRFMFAHQRYTQDLEKKEILHDWLVQDEKRKALRSFVQSKANLGIYMGTSYRQLSLPGFNTYNCDQVARMENPLRLPERFVKEDRSIIKGDQIIVCDTRAKATFYFNENYGIAPACSEDGFGFILLNSNGKTYYISGKEARQKVKDDRLELKELPD
ncbi:MAG: hypothetical protein ACYC1Q_11040, partial [Bacteroidia bacterium]